MFAFILCKERKSSITYKKVDIHRCISKHFECYSDQVLATKSQMVFQCHLLLFNMQCKAFRVFIKKRWRQLVGLHAISGSFFCHRIQ